MLFMRVKQFYKKTRRKLEFNGKEPIGFDKTMVECYNYHRRRHFARDCRSARILRNMSRDAMHAGYRGRDNEEEAIDFALMAFTSNPSSSSSSNSEAMFDNCSSDKENSLANDMFKKDDPIYKFKISETVTSLAKDDKDAPETSTAGVEKPKKDRSSDPLIQDWETDSDNDIIFRPEPIPAKIDFVKTGESVKHVKPVDSVKHVNPVKSVKTVEQTKKSKHFSLSFKIDRKDWNGKMTQKLRLDEMAKKSVLPTNVGKGTGHRESRPVWNNVQRIDNQNKFAPTTVFTWSGRIPVSTTKPKAAASTNAVKPVNTAGPKQSVNFSKSRKAVSAVKGNEVTTVKTSAGYVWRPRVNDIDQLSKDNRWICTRVDYGHPQQALKNKRIVDSGCSRHMIGNKAYLTDYQEINDGDFVAFGSSKGKISGKVTDNFSRFSWVFFLASKDETSKVLKPFITAIENQINKKVKVIRCDNGTEFKNSDLDEFCGMKGIKMEYSNAITPQALETKTHNRAPYEILNGRTSRLDFMRPFGCPVTILNTLDPLGKFKGKVDEGFLVGYFVTSKAFKVFNTKTRKVEENIFAGNQTKKNAGPQNTNGNACTQDNVDAGKEVSDQHYIVLPLWSSISSTLKSSDDKATDDKPTDDTSSNTVEEPINKEDQAYRDELDRLKAIETKWVYMNKKDENGILVRNKARMVAQGHRQEEGIYYDEVFAPVARIEAIRIFLAFASYMGFMVYQIDVKSSFLYAIIEEDVYVCQPPGFIDPQFPNKVNKVYVDDIIFGSTKNSLCDEFEALMHKRFQISSMGELTFFLGLHVKQSEEGIFISQDKYVVKILKKFDFSSVKIASTPIETQNP
nr:retrovirus-related Pol polyprotein from transposon TNT 1-94 [Tanacetum cinerariifolium]GEV55991.1 retrovirus-related Pol polyprotein from transposon TNT 1-94 [Tanacetum cinerariifolium]